MVVVLSVDFVFDVPNDEKVLSKLIRGSIMCFYN